MDVFEQLKKYKELLDSDIITQEEFDKKKNELLNSASVDNAKKNIAETAVKREKNRKTQNKKNIKAIVIIVVIVFASIVGIFAAKKIIIHSQQTKRAAALETQIRSIMSESGLDTYTVKYNEYNYEVYAEDFESLTNNEALYVLEKLNDVYTEDPCGKLDEIDFGTLAHVHPGLDVVYTYWFVPSALVSFSKTHGGAWDEAGIYCNRSGANQCVYQCDTYVYD